MFTVLAIFLSPVLLIWLVLFILGRLKPRTVEEQDAIVESRVESEEAQPETQFHVWRWLLLAGTAVMATISLWWLVPIALLLIAGAFLKIVWEVANEPSSGGGGYYSDNAAPVSKSSRRERVTYTIYKRTSNGYEYTFSSRLGSAGQAIQMAQNQVSQWSNRGTYWRVQGSDGSTVWTGQA